MTISVLDSTDGTTEPLGDLHDAAEQVDEEQLPCRVNDPELCFAESPADVEFAKTLCMDCPSGPCVSPALSSGASRGASGAASSSFREW